MEPGNNIRKVAVAGSFYPKDPKELGFLIDDLLDKTGKIELPGKLKAMIVPHAGYAYSGLTAAWGFRQLKEAEKYNHFVLIGPSHSSGFDGLAGSSKTSWETPLGPVKQIVPKENDRLIRRNDEVHTNEHCLEVELPFLQKTAPRFSMTNYLTGIKVHKENTAGYLLSAHPDSFFLISSDLSHYLSLEDAENKDGETISAILNKDIPYFDSYENVACGAEGIALLLTMTKMKNWYPKKAYYDTSFTASGDESAVVGYTSILFYEK